VIEVRPFNHIGPRQALGFVVPDFASQLAAIKLGWREPSMSVGNLSAERDFTDVRDVVRAYTLLAEQGEPGSTYIVCSGEPTPISFLLHTLIEIADVPVEITQDPDRMRPSETPTLYGSFARLQGDTGWSPEIPIKRSLGDTFSDWIDRQRNEHLAQQRTS
jgi:GDP-4-dehydro-6-deoxy-D-mannose reductase